MLVPSTTAVTVIWLIPDCSGIVAAHRAPPKDAATPFTVTTLFAGAVPLTV